MIAILNIIDFITHIFFAGEVVTFKSIDIGEVAFLRSLQSHCSAKEIIQLKVGAQVSVHNNACEIRFFVNQILVKS